MISPTPAPDASRRRRSRTASFALPVVFATVPPRVFGHALVVVMCLVVAYAGRTNRLSDQIGFLQLQPDSSRPATLSGPGWAATDALVRPAVGDTSSPAAQRLLVTHYETQPGDTVPILADRFDITENTIIWTNNLSVDGHIEPGMELVILPVSGVLYTVQDGDTLDAIAQRFQSDPDAIAQVNQLVNTSAPAKGTPLIIPGGRPLADPRLLASAESITRPNVSRTDNTATAVADSTVVGDSTARSGLDVSSALDLFRRLPFTKSTDPGLAPPPAAQPTPLAPIVYNVVDGDTLLGIAAKFNVSADAIVAASGIQGTGNALSIGQKLLIPPIPGVLHTVQDGDTLGQIAERYGASESDIVRANSLAAPYVLKVGQVVVVPGGSLNPAPAPVPTADTSYAVQDGDSLSTISQAFGIQLQAIIDANGLQDPYLIHPGQMLMIRGATHVTPPPAAASPPADASPSADNHPALATAAPATAAPATAVAVARPQAVATPAPAVVQAPIMAAPVAPAPVRRPVAVAAAPVRSASSSNWGVVDVAARYLGTPYVWGGTSPGGFDCSGLVWYAYRKAGVRIPRDMWGQLQSGSRVSRSNLQPGDIVFFAGTYEAGLSHEGIYIGGGRFIHAADYGIGVIVSSFSNSYYANHYFGATRP